MWVIAKPFVLLVYFFTIVIVINKIRMLVGFGWNRYPVLDFTLYFIMF